MKLLKIIFIVLINISYTIYAQENKLSVAYVITKTEKGQTNSKLHGIEFEYERKLSNSFSVSINAEYDRLNTFPNFTNGGLINPNPELENYIYKNVRVASSLFQKVNQQIYTFNGNYYPLNRDKHKIYLTLGTGLNIQDALEYFITYAKININQDGSTVLVEYKSDYQPRTSKTVIMQTGLGYDYEIKNNWGVGANVRFQLPLARDRYYFKHGGFGFDETLRVGVKVGKRF